VLDLVIKDGTKEVGGTASYGGGGGGLLHGERVQKSESL